MTAGAAAVWPAAVACAVSLAATGGARVFLSRRLVDAPNERSSHTEPTPSGGGLGLMIGLLVALGAAVIAGVGEQSERVVLPLLAAGAAAAIGFVDDARPLGPRIKMVLLVAATAPILHVATLHVTEVPYVGRVGLAWLAVPLTLFWLAGFANAFNFMDGINGIAGFTTAIAAGLYWCVGAQSGDAELALLAAVTCGAAVGFLPWNFPRARIFMGDTGSLPLGLLLATFGLLAAQPGPGSNASQLAFPTAVLALGPFVFDTTFTLVRRALRGAPLGEAHREHLYQRLSRLWGGHAGVTLLYAAMSAATAVLAWRYARFGPMGKALSLILPLAAMLAFAGIVLRAERKRDSTPAP